MEHEYIDRGTARDAKPWPNATLVREATSSELPRSVSCHTSLHFVRPDPEKCDTCRKAECEDNEGGETNSAPAGCTCAKPDERTPYAWSTVYERDGKAVIIERSLGKGTIVLSALSYFVSNEAMRNERHPGLLAWLVGGNRRVIFDEMHHGIMQQHGMATLARKYRLHWLGIGLLLLAALFVWKNSAGLVPPDATGRDGQTAPVAIGKDSASGLVNLLRRNIGRRTILKTCLDEYRASIGRIDNRTAQKLERAEQFLAAEENRPERQRDRMKEYSEICRILNGE